VVTVERIEHALRAGRKPVLLLTGGGAALDRSAAESLCPDSPVVVPERPEWANARGLHDVG
jgi:hypothetical protein